MGEGWFGDQHEWVDGLLATWVGWAVVGRGKAEPGADGRCGGSVGVWVVLEVGWGGFGLGGSSYRSSELSVRYETCPADIVYVTKILYESAGKIQMLGEIPAPPRGVYLGDPPGEPPVENTVNFAPRRVNSRVNPRVDIG